MKETLQNYYKMNILPAIKTVLHDLRTNRWFSATLCVLVVLFVLQIMLGSVLCAQDSNTRITDASVRESYNYHIVFRNINSTMRNTLKNNVDKYEFRGNGAYELVDTVEVDNGGEVPYYDVYIRLKPDSSDNQTDLNIIYYGFMQQFRYLGENCTADASVTTSPLFYADAPYRWSTFMHGVVELMSEPKTTVRTMFNIDVPYIPKPFLCIPWDHLADNGDAVFVCTIAILCAVSFIVFCRMYAVQLNHKKHTYGIYMTFGADRNKLFTLSAWEAVFLSLMTILPAFGGAALINLFLHRGSGVGYRFRPGMLIAVYLLSLAISLLALAVETRRMARRPVMHLLIAENNANHVTSPPVSFEFYGLNYPRKYALINYWRFRKYFAALVVFTTLFTALFVCGNYFAGVYADSLISDEPQYTIKLESGTDWYEYNYMIREKLEQIDGVTGVYSRVTAEAAEIAAHLLLPEKSVGAGGEYILTDNGEYATNEVTFVLGDINTAAQLASAGADEDALAFAEDSSRITIALSENGARRLKLSPGDTVRIAKYASAFHGIDAADTPLRTLRQELSAYAFTYTEFTVSTVIREEMPDDNIRVYLNHQAYLDLAGNARAETYLSHLALDPLQITEVFVPGVSDHWQHFVDFHTYADSESYSTYAAVSDVTYYAADDYTIFALENKPYEGDLEAPLLYKNNVILSRSISGNRALSVSVGDTIEVAVVNGVAISPDIALSGMDRLSAQVAGNSYTYYKFTVGAIVDDPDAQTLSVYFAPDDYRTLTGNSQHYDTIDIFVDPTLSTEQLNRQFSDIRTWGYSYNDKITITNRGAVTAHSSAVKFNYAGYARMLSILLPLILLPCLLYTQMLFYTKRQEETKVLRVFGASTRMINALYLTEAVILILLCLIVYPLFVFAGVLPIFHATRSMTGVLAGFSFPLAAFLIGMLITAAQCALSVFIPWMANENEELNFK